MGSTDISKSATTVDENNLDYILNFQRYERKYYFPHSRIEFLIPEILRYMKYDPYSNGKYYNLYSVYYDTEDWQAYYEKMDGIERRKKFRVRSYYQNPGPEDEVMIEIKEKNKDIILKRRTAIKYKYVENLSLGKSYIKQDDVYDEWRYSVIRNSIKPRIQIAYQRMAFVPKEHGDLRITLDRHVKYTMTHNKQQLFEGALRKTQFSYTDSVLEIKYKDHPPKFVNDLVHKYNLSNEAISKFCESVVTNYRGIL